jgi:hypothetical protein
MLLQALRVGLGCPKCRYAPKGCRSCRARLAEAEEPGAPDEARAALPVDAASDRRGATSGPADAAGGKPHVLALLGGPPSLRACPSASDRKDARVGSLAFNVTFS